jgi:hypothetical protein
MPASCSLYRVISDKSLEELRSELENVKLEEQREIYGETYRLTTFISDVHYGAEEEVLWGTLSFEIIEFVPQIDGRRAPIRLAERCMFALFYEDITLYLAIFTNRKMAENSAGKMNYILTRSEPEPGLIVLNFFISTTTIEQLLANHPHTKKRGSWSDLDFPGVNRGSLHGVDIDRFDQTRRYDEHGKKSYIMVEFHDLRAIVGISAKGMITFYGNITNEQILEFIRREIVSA